MVSVPIKEVFRGKRESTMVDDDATDADDKEQT